MTEGGKILFFSASIYTYLAQNIQFHYLPTLWNKSNAKFSPTRKLEDKKRRVK